FGFRTGFGAASAAGFAGDGGGDADLRVLAQEGFLEGNFHVVAEIAAAVLPAPTAPTAHELAEQIVEHVGEGRGKVETETIGAATATVLERGVSEAVIGRALLAVFEDVVGLADFLEAGTAAVIVRVAVGMK